MLRIRSRRLQRVIQRALRAAVRNAERFVREEERRAGQGEKKHVEDHLLIIDGWTLESLKEDEAREIVETCSTRRSLMLRSQFTVGGWAKKLGGGAIAGAIVDRFAHNSYVIRIEGDESMRKRTSDLD